ncbi:MAG: hypothetical protein K2O24_05065 [Muribaculaceae bacterium]|nr:hypothetical protein [Muribaculaceae bacterium]
MILACIATGLFAYLYLFGYGEIWADESYQTFCVLHPEMTRLAPLTFFMGHGWLSVTGMKILNLRFLAVTLGCLTVVVSCFYAWRRTRNVLLASLLFMVCSWIWRMDAFMLYNWESGTLLWDALGMIAAVEFFRRPSCARGAICGAAFALMTAGRLPSGIIMPIFLGILWWGVSGGRLSRRVAWTGGLASSASFCLVLLLIIIVLYGSIGAYVSDFSEYVVSGHGVGGGFAKLKWRMMAMVPAVMERNIVPVACILLPLLFRHRLRDMAQGRASAAEKRRTLIAALICVVCIVVTGIFMVKQDEAGLQAEGLMGAACGVAGAWILLPAVRNFAWPGKKPLQTPVLSLAACAAVLVAMMFGSDAYFERVEAGFSLPVIVAVLWCMGRGAINRYLVTSLGVVMVGCVSIVATQWDCMRKVCVYRPIEVPELCTGIVSPDDYDKEYAQWEVAVKDVRKSGDRWVLLSDDRIRWRLMLGVDDGPGVHDYHFKPSNIWKMPDGELQFLDSITAVVYLKEDYMYDSDLQMTLKELAARGFVNETDRGAAVILRR